MSQATPDKAIVIAPVVAANENLSIPFAEGAKLELDFDQNDASISRVDNDLVFSFDNGGQVHITNFFVTGGAELPMLVLQDGTKVPSHDLLAALNPDMDLATAAGPTAAAPGSNGVSSYADDAGALISGLDRMGSLGTSQWGRGTELGAPRDFNVPEVPGGTLNIDVSSLGGMIGITNGLYEDGRPEQHLHGNSANLVAGRIDFSFTPTGTTVVDLVTLSGFPEGTKIYLGDPNDSNSTEITNQSQSYSFTEAQLNGTGVYVIPPKDSDADMDISAQVDIRSVASGGTGTINGNFTFVVDAVADKPEIDDENFGNVDLNGSIVITESSSATQEYKDGWAQDALVKDGTTTAENVTITVPFTATITFGDFAPDTGENHYALVEVPQGDWTPTGLPYTIETLWIKQIDGKMYVVEEDTVGATEKQFYKFEVDNADINADGTYNLNITFTGSDSTITSDTTIKLTTGAMAHEPIEEGTPGNREIDFSNNTSYTLTQNPVDFDVDTIDSKLNLNLGWFSEGGDGTKNVGSGSYTAPTDVAGATDAGEHAKIELQLDTSSADAHGEHITKVEFSYDEERGELQYNGSALASGDYTINGTTYTVVVDHANNTVSISISGNAVTSLGDFGLTFAPNDNYTSTDIELGYKVTVESSKGASAEFSGNSTIVVDAVADKGDLSAITPEYEGSYTAVKPGGTLDLSGSVSFPDTKGTETQYIVFNIPQGWSIGGQEGLCKNQIDGEFKEIGGDKVLGGGDVLTPVISDTAPEYFVIELVRDADGNCTGYKILVADGSNNLTEASDAVKTALAGLINISEKSDGSVEYTITLTAPSSITSDTQGTVSVKPITVVNNPGDREYDYSNNIAVSGKESTPIKIAVVDSVLSVTPGTAFEDNISAIHTNDGTQVSDHTNGALIQVNGLNTGAAAGDDEVIESMTFTFDALNINGNTVPSGSIYYDGQLQSMQLVGGVYQVIIENYDPSKATYFVPGNNNSDKDVTLGYNAKVVDPSSGADKTFTGNATIVIDAVADKPVVTISTDGTQVDYLGENGGNVAGVTAQPNETVVLHATVEFNDLDGSENHYILIQADVPGVAYDSYSLDGTTFTSLSGVTIEDGYYKIPVNTAEPRSGSFDVSLKVSANPSADKEYTIKVGGQAVEQATKAGGGENDENNNSSITTGDVTFEASPAEKIKTPSIISTYEDLRRRQNTDPNCNKATKGKVTFETNDDEGDEVITEIVITYDGNIHDIGTVTCPMPNAVLTIDTISEPGKTIITVTPGNGTIDLGKKPFLEFNPKADSDIDFKFDYKVTTLDPESGHTNDTSTGTSTIVIDAAADKPQVIVAKDGTQVDYQSEKNASGNVVNDNTKAAKPGETLTVNIKEIAFGDYEDGSESHWVYINKYLTDGNDNRIDADNTAGDDTVALLIPQTITLTGNGYTMTIKLGDSAGTTTITITDAGGLTIGSPATMTDTDYKALTQVDTYSNFKIPVSNDFLQRTEGKISASFDITAPDVKGDTHYVLTAGGYAKDKETDEYLSRSNNDSFTPEQIHFDVRPVTSKPHISIDLGSQQIYENQTPDANKGYYANDGKVAEIKLSGIDTGETATITLIFSNKNEHGSAIDFSTSKVTVDGVDYLIQADGTCTINIAGSDNQVDGKLIFTPGNNYNSQDIKVEYELSVTDNASGEVKYWNNTGDTTNNATVQDNNLTIQVDAVAQKPVFGYEDKTGDGETPDDYYGLKADYGAKDSNEESVGGKDAFVKGGAMAITAEVTFQDYEDDSEKHFLLVEAKAGWSAPTEIVLVDADGNAILDAEGKPVVISAAGAIMQPYDHDNNPSTPNLMFYRLEIPNEYIALCKGTIHAQIWMSSPTGVGSSASFKVGAMANEDAAALNRDNVEFDTRTGADSNNVSITINDKEVSVSFDKVGSIWLSAGEYVSENDTSKANEGISTPDGGTEITIGGTSGDEITDFQFTDYDSSKGIITFNGVEIRADGTPIDSTGNPIVTLHPGDKFVFIPAKNYSDQDVNLSYKATVTDPNSGDTYTTNNGNVPIVVDAVAQKPGKVTAVDPADGDQVFHVDHGIYKLADNGAKQTINVKVTANFEDYIDGSESHYVLVEVKPNMYISDKDGNKIDCEIYYGKDGARYYKIPVSNGDIEAGNGKITLDNLYLTMYSRKLGIDHRSDTVKVGSLSEETKLSDSGERDFNNNTAENLVGAPIITIEHDWLGGDIIWVNPAYENNTAQAYRDDGNSDNGMHPLETPHQGGHITFGTDVTEATLTWDPSKGSIVVNGVANTTGSITLTGEDLKNAYFQPTKNYSDNDVDLGYTAKTSDGATHSGNFPVIVDAVAQMPEDMKIDYNYGDNGAGGSWQAIGAPNTDPNDKSNDGIVTITIGGSFADDNNPGNNGFADTSENHYALLEKLDGYQIVDEHGNVIEPKEIYLNGITWYQIPIASGQSSVDVNIRVLDPAKATPSYNIKTGLMAKEQALGTPGNFEGDSSNNIALNLTGNTEIKVSLVDTDVTINVAKEMDENEVLDINVTSLNIGTNDVFLSFELNFDSAKGNIVLSFQDPNPYSEGTDYTIANGNLTITSQAMMQDIANKNISLGYKPNDYSDKDFDISWSTKAQDTLSGDTASTSGSRHVIVDAVAHAPEVSDQKFIVDGTHSAAQSGQQATATATVTFVDLDGSSKHYVVLEQDGIWVCNKITINGVEYTQGGNPGIITMFSQNGTPYYALDVTNLFSDEDKLANKGSLEVKFGLDAPVRTGDLTLPNQGDVDSTLNVGGITVETTTGAGADRETNLSNNWGEGLKDGTFIPASMAVVETSKVEVSNTGPLKEDAAQGTNLSFSNTYETDEIITKTGFTITQEGTPDGTVIGYIIYGNDKYEVKAGEPLNLNFAPNGFDSSKGFSFVLHPDNHNSGSVTINSKSTVEDIKSGAEKTFTDEHTINVEATADAPTDLNVTDPTNAVGGGQAVSFDVSAKFVDTDDSEHHYILVEAPDNWTSNYGIPINVDGTNYFKVPVSSTNPSPTVTVTLYPPSNTTVDQTVTLKVGGMAVEKSNGDTQYTKDEDTTVVNIKIGVVQADSVTINVGEPGLTGGEGRELNFTLNNADNDSITSITLTLPAGAAIYKDGTPLNNTGGKVTITDLTAEYTFIPPANSAGDVDLKYSIIAKDNASGASKTFTGTIPVEVNIPAIEAAIVEGSAVEGQQGIELLFSAANLTALATYADASGILQQDLSIKLLLSDGTGTQSEHTITIPQGYELNNPSAIELDGVYIGYSTANSTGYYGDIAVKITEIDGHEVSPAAPVSTETVTPSDSLDFSHLDAGVDNSAGTSDVDHTITGTSFDDILHGGAGNDTIYGGAGNDTIYGGLGNDLMDGGEGTDLFVWTPEAIGGADTIQNFSFNEDKICVGILTENNDILQLHDILENQNNSLDPYLQNILSNATVAAEGITLKITSGGHEQTIEIHMDAGQVQGYDNYESFKNAYDSADQTEASRMLQDLLLQMTTTC